MPRTFAKGALMQWEGNKISDHNRSELSVDVNRIENTKRMANGTMRKYVIADKRTFQVSWKDLPHTSAYTVDGFWGGQEIEAWYDAQAGPFNLRLTFGDGSFKNFVVMMTQFSKSISKRGKFDFWDVDVEMEEV